MKIKFATLAFALAGPVMMAPASAQEVEWDAAEQTEAYSVQTTKVAVLLDDPEAAAILEEHIPTIYANELFQTMGRGQTLKGVQQFESTILTDEKLAEIQLAFDALATED